MGTYRQRRGAGGEGAGEGGAAATSLAAASLVITAAELSPPLHPRWGSLGGALGAPPAPLCLSIYQVGAWGGKCGGEVWGEGGRCGVRGGGVGGVPPAQLCLSMYQVSTRSPSLSPAYLNPCALSHPDVRTAWCMLTPFMSGMCSHFCVHP